jgi:hypothetical protein
VAVEEAIATRHMMHSIGVPVNGPVDILCDNMLVVLNTTVAGSALKKKHISIAYHMIWEAIAAGVVTFGHIGTEDNVADIMTKVLPSKVRNSVKINTNQADHKARYHYDNTSHYRGRWRR